MSRRACDIMNNAAVHYRDARESARAAKCHLTRIEDRCKRV